MPNDVVKYHNDLNMVSMRNWTAEDMNFFFAIISKIRGLGTEEINLTTDEIKKIINYDDRENRWVKVLDSIGDKISSLRYIEKSDKKVAYFMIFQRFVIDIDEKTVNLKVSSDFEYIVNKLTRHFTTYELAEFTQIRSTYAKTMYRILKQWRTVGVKEFKIEEFKRLLDMPEYYKPSQINKNVLTPIRKELPQYFKDLKIKVIKANTQGTPVIAYRFTWQAEKTNAWDPNKYNKKPSKKKKPYRSDDGAEVANRFAAKRREEWFKKIAADREKNEQ